MEITLEMSPTPQPREEDAEAEKGKALVPKDSQGGRGEA